MHLLHRSQTGQITLTRNYISNIPDYAILSHTWGEEDSEVTYQDFATDSWRHKPGAIKIDFCGTQAALDGLEYFWIDTCCIDKKDSVELQEAINSMFRWYKESTKCYVYLSDVNFDFWSAQFGAGQLGDQIRRSRWFTRGWTLQELIAPKSVEFFARQRYRIGDQISMSYLIQEITRIPLASLQRISVFDFPIDVRWSWAEGRQTTRPEDQAYCLWGIFDCHMTMIYGEGVDKATRRLRREIEDARRERERYSTYGGVYSSPTEIVPPMQRSLVQLVDVSQSPFSSNGLPQLNKGGAMSNSMPALTKGSGWAGFGNKAMPAAY